MTQAINKSNLGYLGEDFQYKLIHTFMANSQFFKDLNSIVDQNMFTNAYLKIFVGILKEYYEREEAVPSYSMMKILLNEKAHNDIEKEIFSEVCNTIMNTSSDGEEYIKDLAEKFFKQQNIIKTANKILQIAGDGDTSKYESCVELLNEALNKGSKDEFGSGVFDDLGETLSDDYRIPIPTGIGKLDESLEGGLGKGEIGVIIGPTSFGKVQPYDALVLTPFGFTKMKNIKIGSQISRKDGTYGKVTNVFKHNNWAFYKIKFNDNTYAECGLEHLWTVKINNNAWQTLSLNDIIEYKYKNPNAHIYIPVCSNIIYKDKNKSYKKRLKKLKEFYNSYGYYDFKKKSIIFEISNNQKIIELQDIINSLGGLCIVKYIKEQQTYQVIITYVNSSFEELYEERWEKKKELREIEHIEFSRISDGQCIKVDASDELYITNNYIVTHNTSLTTAMASYAATYKCEQNNFKGFKVVQIVFEDRIKQIQRKHLGRITNIEAKDLSKKDNIDKVKEILQNYEDKEMLANNIRIFRFPSGEITVLQLKRFLKKLINRGFSPDMVILDYFECLSHDCFTNVSNDYDKEGKSMRKLESLANELNIAIWIPSQGTKDSINLDLVTMDKIGGSVKKAQVAHVIMSIARTIEDIEANKATIALLKNRAGKSGKVFNNVEFNNGTCRISTDNVDEFDNMMEYNKNNQKEKLELARNIYKISQEKKLNKKSETVMI